MAKIYGFCIVQNEGDVIGESLEWAARFCEKIWAWDLGSRDDTWDALQRVASDRICVAHRPDVQYSKRVRIDMLAGVRSEIPEGSWLYRHDADEFIMSDPRPVLEAAEAEGAQVVKGWHMMFEPTEDDLARIQEMGREAWEAIPLEDRLRHYQLGHPHWRFLKLDPGVAWTEIGGRSKLRCADGSKPRRARRELLIRHYQHRSPSQVNHRFETRQAIRSTGYGGFDYDNAPNFGDYVRRTRACEYWDGGHREIGPRDVLWWRVRRLARLIQRFAPSPAR